MDTVNLTDARAHLSELVNKAERGEETIITRCGKPVARLVPIAPTKKAFRSLAEFRATLPMAREPSAKLIRRQRNVGY